MPAAPKEFEAWPVPLLVNKPDNDGPELAARQYRRADGAREYVDAITREGDAPAGGAARASMRKCHRAHCGPSPICLVMSGAFTVT